MAELNTISALFNDANLVAYYRMESGALTTDSSGSGFTLTNNGTVAESTGKFSGASTSGTSNSTKYLSITNDLGITNGNITASIWVKSNTTPGGGTVTTFFEKGDSGTHVRYWIKYNDNSGTPTLTFNRQRENIANNQVSYAHTLSTTEFTHLVLTYGGTNVEAFVNGVSVGTIAATGDGASGVDSDYTYFYAGRSQAPAVVFYSNAQLDDCAIFNRKLTDTEILTIYKEGSSFFMMF